MTHQRRFTLQVLGNLSQRLIARSLKIGLGTVSLYLNCAKAAGIGWPLAPGMSDDALEQALFFNLQPKAPDQFAEPDYLLK